MRRTSTERNARRSGTGRAPRTLGALLAALLLGCTAPQPPPERPPDAELVAQGAALYAAHCAACHGPEGRGDGPAAAALAPPPSDLTRIAARRGGEFPAAEVSLFIDGRFAPAAHGSRAMPVWGQRFREELPESELREPMVRGRLLLLVTFLESIQEQGPAPGEWREGSRGDVSEP